MWTHLPFGLSASPYIFNKTLRETIKKIRHLGIRINCYMDDVLILGRSLEETAHNTQKTIKLLQQYGWKINREKSHLTPTQQLEYLGFIIHTIEEIAYNIPFHPQVLLVCWVDGNVMKAVLEVQGGHPVFRT